MESIWYRDPTTFIKFENLPKFVPIKGMTYVEQLNAIMRFSIYFAIILFVVNRNILVFYFVVFSALMTFAMYEFYSRNKKLQKELYEKANLHYDKGANELCIKPSKNNPFMNVLMNEYAEFPNRPRACNIASTNVKRQAENLFDVNLYRDVDDIWTRKTTSRNWHTVPSTTIPSDRDSFTKWLYDPNKKSCKEGNSSQCFNNLYTSYKI